MQIDISVIIIYFIATIMLGFWAARGVKTAEDFATGGRSYGTFAVFATLSAAFIGGGFTIGLAEKVFIGGIGFVIAMWGFSVKEILIAQFVAPRMSQFRDVMTVGDLLGQAYGKGAKVFTGFASVMICAGILGAQVSAFGYILNVFLGMPYLWGSLLGSLVVLSYATVGGMKSVVANDILHFCVLIIALPLVLVLGIYHTGGIEHMLSQLPVDHLKPTGTLSMLALVSLFLSLFFGETLVPPYVQRLLIGKDVRSTARGTWYSGLLSFVFFAMTGAIGLIALIMKPELSPNLALPYVIMNVMPVGLKGLAIAGMLAVIMSSADAFLNAGGMAAAHDILSPLSRASHTSKQQLLASRLATLVVGGIAIVFALSIASALDILIYAYQFWTPFMLVPLIGVLFGVYVSQRAFWISSFLGIAVVLVWNIALGSPFGFDGAVIGVLCNGACFKLCLRKS